MFHDFEFLMVLNYLIIMVQRYGVFNPIPNGYQK